MVRGGGLGLLLTVTVVPRRLVVHCATAACHGVVTGVRAAGNTVTNTDGEVQGLVEEVAAQLNLKPHVVGRPNSGQQLRTPFPCDVEIHAGADGRK